MTRAARTGPLPLGALVALGLGACGQHGTVVQPGLVTLAVAPLSISPAFSQQAQDYSVRCARGENDLTVEYSGSPGTTVTVSTPKGTATSSGESAPVAVLENDLITIEARIDSAVQQYFIRCLPADFPQIEFAAHPDAGERTPGWYLTGNAAAAGGESGFAMVLDGNGTPLWYERVGSNGVFNVDSLVPGTISYIGDLGPYGEIPGASYTVQGISPAKMTSVAAVGAYTDEHEMRHLSNGDWLLSTYPLVQGVDLTGLKGWGANETIADCTIQEIDPSGSLVWEWKASDHIDPVLEQSLPQGNVVFGQLVADVFHLNSIDVDDDGNLLVSMRDMDTIYYVERSTGKVLWKLGGVPQGKDGEQAYAVVGDPETTFHRQHDARFQPDGCVSVFDDHTNYPGGARGVIYQLDAATSTAKMVYQYATAHFAYSMGSFRRYSDGSSLISWGLSPETPANVVEIDAHGNDVLDFAFGHGDSAYRAVKMPLSAFDAAALRANAMVAPKDPQEAAPAAVRVPPGSTIR